MPPVPGTEMTLRVRSLDDGLVQSRDSARRQPMPCKGHRKSRLGCAMCKDRKVKCDEVTPECGRCIRLGLSCEYKAKMTKKGRSSRGSTMDAQMKSSMGRNSGLALNRSMSAMPVFLDRDNLRFFSHFLITAYPSLPVAGRGIWEHVSQLSHEYDFLMHSMLGLGASHLSMVSPENDSYNVASLKHRVAAINGLNEFLSQPHPKASHAEAALATMLALTFQSSYLPDGLTDFITAVRGCYLISYAENFCVDDSEFASFKRGSCLKKLNELVNSQQPQRCLDPAVADRFIASTQRLAPLCKGTAEVEYLASLQGIVASAASDPVWGHIEHMELYRKVGRMTSEEFASFSDPSNNVGRLLLLHTLLLHVVMSRKVVESQGPRGRLTTPKVMATTWTDVVAENLSEEYRPYSEWAVGFIRSWEFSGEMEDAVWRPIDDGANETG